MNINIIYYYYLIFQNKFIINILSFINIFFPKQMKNNLIYYKKKGDDYYRYLLILSINEEIEDKYNINILKIGMNLYEKYKKNINDDIEDLSDIEDYE